MSEPPAVLHYDGSEVELPVVRGSENELGDRHLQAPRPDRAHHPRLRVPQHRLVRVGDHLHRRRRGHPPLPRHPDRAARRGPRSRRSSRRRTCSSTASSPTRTQLDDVPLRRSASTRCSTRTRSGSSTASRRTRTRWASLSSVGQRAVDLLPRQHRPARPRAGPALDRPADGQAPTIAAYAYKQSIGQPFLYPNNSLDLIENFLTMMFAVPSEPYEVSPTVVHAMKVLLILHADHEQNCSTSTVRLAGSSEANLYASIAAGINALWGPLHGGANQAVIEMLERDPRRRRRRRRSTSRRPRTPTTRSGSRASATASTRTTTRGPGSSRASPTRCSSELGQARRAAGPRARSSRRSRSTTSTSSSGGSTRTSTSTRASSTARWASPPTCSPCSSRWAASPAGSRTGRR